MKTVPEGYTYIRCDQYSPDEFKKRYTDNKGNLDEDCYWYMTMHPKTIYNTDDVIAIHNMRRERMVGSLIARTGKYTTKRYDSRLSDQWTK